MPETAPARPAAQRPLRLPDALLPPGLDDAQRLLLGRLDGWSFGDLELLPDDGRRYEVVGGDLVVRSTPSPAHAYAISELRRALEVNRPRGVRLVEVVGIRAGTGDGYVPDLLAASTEWLGRDRDDRDPADVLLAIEVVSPGSRATDRLVKPLGYAEVGVPQLWRVELDEPAVHVARLLAGTYDEVAAARGAEPLELHEPWPGTLVAVDLVLPAVRRRAAPAALDQGRPDRRATAHPPR